MTGQYFKIAVKNLRTRPLRSWLTILGIVVGIFLVITLISLSEGLKETVMRELKMMGKDLIFVFPGQMTNIMTTFAGGLDLTEEDMKTIKKTEGVATVIAVVYKAEVVKYQGESKPILISGMDWKEAIPVLKEDLGWSLKDGRWPDPGKREVLVGNLVATDLYPEMRIGTPAIIKGKQFEVVGILKSLGNKQDDSLIFTDMEIFYQLTGERNQIKSSVAKVSPGYSADQVAENIKNRLNQTRKRVSGEDTPSFSVLTSEKATGMVSNIMGVIQVVIYGFASIAIIVGGIGIMNTMFTSVRERTREIGILKAIGAKNSAIAAIFLFEAGIIGLIGGIGGVILGMGFAKALEFSVKTTQTLYLRAYVSPLLAFFGLAFSFSVGCLSGFWPARKASQLKPVEALRYE